MDAGTYAARPKIALNWGGYRVHVTEASRRSGNVLVLDRWLDNDRYSPLT
jgi:hypothetical protein